VVEAAHKDSGVADDSIEANPLTELYLKRHPSLLDDAKKTDWESIARGES
jgi:capsule polysaccharide export protein KpsC/LpsZ